MAKIAVIGMMPKTLKLTQKSVEKFRQTISFTIARKMKKVPQRKVSLRHPISSNLKAPSKRYCIVGLPKARPPSKPAANRILVMVGLILMNCSSCRKGPKLRAHAKPLPAAHTAFALGGGFFFSLFRYVGHAARCFVLIIWGAYIYTYRSMGRIKRQSALLQSLLPKSPEDRQYLLPRRSYAQAGHMRAMATRMPPRAVPSNLVMTRPVTPAIFVKTST